MTQRFVYTPQSNGTSPAIWDHTVLPVTWHRWTCGGVVSTCQIWRLYVQLFVWGGYVSTNFSDLLL